jgi:hypothetical protein
MKRRFNDGGIYTAEMGQPPTDPEGVPTTKKSAVKPAAKTLPPKKPMPPKDTVFREGMPVPQDIDGKSAPRKSSQELMQEYRAEKKGVPVDEMRKKAGAEYDKKMKAGEFYSKGGSVGSAAKRGDGIAKKGHTRGRMI